MDARMGLVQAAQQLGSYGRGPDRQLAHISPDESEFLDYMQGGRRTNPHTGLPEYSLFGKILKSVARVAGAVGGFMLAGPAGAALGAGAATKLTGGSWKDALKGAALSGIGGELGAGLSGGGWDVLGNSSALTGALGGGAASGAAGAAGAAPETMFGSQLAAGAPAETMFGSQLAAAAPSAAAPAASGALSGLGSYLAPVGGYGGLGAGLGSLSTPLPQPDGGGGAPLPQSNINLNVAPMARKYQPYQGDYAHYGAPVSQGGSGGWQFFDQVNPKPQFLAGGGPVMQQGGPEMPMGGLSGIGAMHQLGVPSQVGSPQLNAPGQAQPRLPMRDQLRQAAMLGYMHAAKGGTVKGPGDGKSDSVPALLSNNEHVVDAATIADLGNGDPDAGHARMEDIKAEIRRRAGRRFPRKPTPKQSGSAAALVSKVM